ncbi:DUF742 domain-containing protein [Streptomyces griseoviridis]|uniref:DUF742 domain-containing protein n=1 Tax=Streptomyces griseoviridis TaxID=45398 RepID=UPI00344DDBF8
MSPARRARRGDPLVRTYVVTSGRSHASRNHFDLITLITLSESASLLGRASLNPEHNAIVDQLTLSAQSVAELGAYVRLPLSVLRILLADLMDRGYITTRQRITEAAPADRTLLEEVLAGLRKL